MEVAIRNMMPEDYAGKGFVHYMAWQETYRGLVPDPYLDEMTVAGCAQAAQKYPIPTIVAEAKGKIIGFVCYLHQAREFVQRADAAEIAALYVLKDWQGRGIGSRLLADALSRLPCTRVSLFVLDGNNHAVDFYQRKGFEKTQCSLMFDTGYGMIQEWEMLLTNHKEWE